MITVENAIAGAILLLGIGSLAVVLIRGRGEERQWHEHHSRQEQEEERRRTLSERQW